MMLPRILLFFTSPLGASLALIGILIFRFQIDMQVDPDLFARLAVGKIIATTGSIPLHDMFAFTPTKPLWIDHEWLSGVTFYQLFELGGEFALFLAKICFAFLTLAMLFSAQGIVSDRKESLLLRSVWILLLGCFISLVWHTTIRSQAFTYLFLALELLVITKHSLQGRTLPLFILIPIMPIWTNCHGGFVVGLGFLGIHALCQWREPKKMILTLGVLGACLLGTLLNPYGTDYWIYILEAISMKRELIREWASVSPLSAEALPLNLLVLMLLFDFVVRRSKVRLESLLLMGVSLYFGYRHLRFIPIPLMVAAVYFSGSFQRTTAGSMIKGLRYIHAGKITGSLMLLAMLSGWYSLATMVARQHSFSLDYRLMPRAAVDWLEQNRISGNILSSYRHGNYLLWRLHPHFKVATDGRYEEVYTDETFRRAYLAIDPSREGSSAALAAIAPDLIVVDRRQLGGDGAKSYGSEFNEIYRDQYFSVIEAPGAFAKNK